MRIKKRIEALKESTIEFDDYKGEFYILHEKEFGDRLFWTEEGELIEDGREAIVFQTSVETETWILKQIENEDDRTSFEKALDEESKLFGEDW